MKIILYSFLLISVLTYANTSDVLAFEISYKPNGIKLGPEPTICTVEPTESDLASRDVEKLMKQTRYAVDEWETKLQMETRNNKDGWKFNYIEINDRNRINSDRNCDVTFVFEPKPTKAEEYFALGIADYDADTNTSLITLYYLEIEECYHSEREGDTIYYWYETCYGEDMRISNQINAVAKHEFGHALGLAHYEPDDIEIAELWAKGTKMSPSIMVELAFENSNEMQIRDVDINMLYSIYGDDGFIVSENEREHFELFTVMDYWEKKEYEKLQNYLDEFLQKNPSDEDGIYYQALVYYDLKKYGDAIPFLERAIKNQPENSDLLYYQARSLYNVENYVEAFTYIEKAVDVEPDSLRNHSRHGVILFELGRYDDALDSYRTALSINPNDPITLDRRGQVHHQLGDYEKAITYFDMALDVEPERKSALVNKANAFFELQEYEEAINHYQMVLDKDPKNLESLRGMMESLDNMGDEREAAKFYEKLRLIEGTTDTFHLQDKTVENISIASDTDSQIPEWIRTNAKWWASGQIDDSTFVSAIEFLVKEGIVKIPPTIQSNADSITTEIPSWVKNNADWWGQGLISDEDFIKGIQHLMEHGIVIV